MENKYWWQQCVHCIEWGQVSGRCRFCSRCPFSAGGCGDGFVEREGEEKQ